MTDDQAAAVVAPADTLTGTVMQGPPEPMALLDGAGVVRAVNAAWAARAWTPGVDLAGGHVGADYLAACQQTAAAGNAYARQAAEGITAVLRGEQAAFRLRYPAAATARWRELRVVPFMDGAGALLTLADDDSVAPDAQACARLSGLLDAGRDVQALVDQTGQIRSINAPARAAFGWEPSALVGQPLALLLPEAAALAAPHDRASFIATARPRPGGGGHSTVGRHADGSELPVELSITPLATEPGELAVVIRDSSARRRFEEALRRNRQRFATLVEHLPDIVSRLDRDLRFTYISPAIGERTGLPAAAWLGRRATEVGVSAAAWQPLADACAGAFATGAVQVVEGEVEGRYLRTRVVPETDASGAVASVLCITEDMTDSHRAERERAALLRGERAARAEALRANRRLAEAYALMDTLFEQAPVGLVFWDRALRFQRVNARLAAMNGLPAADHIGRTPSDLLPMVEGLDAVLADWRRVMETGEPLLGYEMRGGTPTAPDRIRTWRSDYYPVRVGDEVIGLGGIVSDVTDEKRALLTRDLLARVGERLADPLDAGERLRRLADPLLPELADWAVIYARRGNDDLALVADAGVGPEHREALRALQAFGSTRTGRRRLPTLRALDTSAPQLIAAVPDDWVARLQPPPALAQQLARIDLRSYLVVPLVARARTVGVMALGRRSGSPAFEPPELDSALQVGRLAALLIENAELFEEERAAVALRDGVLASVSHDLKGPLAVISGYAQVVNRMTRRFDAVPADRLRPALIGIEQTADKMLAQINLLLDTVRLASGQGLTLRPAPLDLVALARRVAAAHGALAAEHGLTVVAESESVVGRWDPVQIERVVDNLISNAVKYTPDGGLVSARVARVTDGRGAWAELVVADTGIGIPAADLPYIFQPFRRGSNVIDRYAGTGIGLAGVKQLVELHGGMVRLESVEGQGTTVTVRLPLG